MKRSFLFAVVISCFVVTSCNDAGIATPLDGVDTTKKGVRVFDEDSAFIVGWNKHSNSPDFFKSTFDQPIKAAIAQKCIDEYIGHFGRGANTTGVGFTQLVRFDTQKFKYWTIIDKIFDRSNMIVIEFGIYTREVYELLRADEDIKNDIPETHIGKITVFVSPYERENVRAKRMDGTEIDPFNLGSLHP